ncbi:Histone acetyltransferase HPA2 and related acetyltransferase (plasmid) [Priestia megaterium]|uniref:GNAT family N-acetyltransferase n=1 Tax=Priestia TaxID=2800373 RepID=UPI0015DBE523|nr:MULTISPECIES: GNAT family N-acetyltransferase [Priestia]MCG0050745.1 GNAT family N-acetyltransferase [Priestia aryabhattai]QLK09390.1 Histone acetyltransferase HPA2 and related acetyltransferase [Priestia megaterium]
MKIEFATESDYEYIANRDKHLLKGLLLTKINEKEIYILRNQDDMNIGWMRYGYFWDNTPFMNMIWIDEEYRNNGVGKQVVIFWENEMKKMGCKMVMTSTLANEDAQHFYRKLGYKDSGCLLIKNEPLEIILTKVI